MRTLALASGWLLAAAAYLISSCGPAVQSSQANAALEKRLASGRFYCEFHGALMESKLQKSLDPYPFDVTARFQKKRQRLFCNDGITFSSCCGYHPAAMTWVCPVCAKQSLRERRRCGISE